MITVTVRLAPSALIHWDNPTAIRDGYCTDARRVNGELIGQFCMAPIYVTDMADVWEGTWAENTMATRLTQNELHKIAALQEADEYTVNQKMGWLCAGIQSDGWGSPINTKGEDWQTATDIKMITACYAGQPVTLTGETLIRRITLSGNTNMEKLHRVKTYPPAVWTRANSQIVTAVSRNNVYTENTKGKIVLPMWFGDRKAFVLDRWLVK